MPRRRWIKLWTQETLYGTTTRELEPAERWVWLGFLALAGDSVEPGTICAAPGVPWTDKQLSDVLKVSLAVLESAKTKMLNHGKITINEGIIHISNWEKYQSEYDRTKKYRGTIFSGPNATPKSTTQLNVEKAVEKVQENVSSIPDQTIPDQTIPDQKTIYTTTAREENLAKIAKLYEDNIGRLTSVIGERLKDIAERYPAGWFEEALKEAVELEHRNLRYIASILERWKVEGFKAPRKEGKGGKQPRQERARPITYIKGSGEDPERKD